MAVCFQCLAYFGSWGSFASRQISVMLPRCRRAHIPWYRSIQVRKLRMPRQPLVKKIVVRIWCDERVVMNHTAISTGSLLPHRVQLRQRHTVVGQWRTLDGNQTVGENVFEGRRWVFPRVVGDGPSDRLPIRCTSRNGLASAENNCHAPGTNSPTVVDCYESPSLGLRQYGKRGCVQCPMGFLVRSRGLASKMDGWHNGAESESCTSVRQWLTPWAATYLQDVRCAD